jgi:FtsP/CotA-like multicopper oxidase with cupredoxin domain
MNSNTKIGVKRASGQVRFKLLTSTAMVAMALASMSAMAGAGKVCLENDSAATPPIANPNTNCKTGTIGTYYANSPTLRKFVDTLPGLTSGNTNTFASGKPGEYLSVAVADTTTYPGSEYFIIGVVEHDQWMHSDLQKPTTLRGYVQLYPRLSERPVNATNPPTPAVDNLTHQKIAAPVALTYPDGTAITWPGSKTTANPAGEQVYAYNKPNYLGPIILTLSGTPVRSQMVNLLPTGRAKPDGAGSVTARNGDIFLPVDESLGGAGLTPAGDKYPQNRAAFHLHGGDSPWISDGTPHQWIAPAADNTAYKSGSRVMNVPDMPFPGEGSLNVYWPNDQSARLMWYHDHTFGLTRQNAYGGEAAGYVIMDAAELALLGLNADLTPAAGAVTVNGQSINKAIPNTLLEQIVLVLQDKTFVPNDIATQDSKWDTKAWGQPGDLWYPHVYEPFQIWDANAINGVPYYTTTTTTTTTTIITVTDTAGVSTTTGPTDAVVSTSTTSPSKVAPVGSTSTTAPVTTTTVDSTTGDTTDTTVTVKTDVTVATATPNEQAAVQTANAIPNPAGRWDYAVNDLDGTYLPPKVGATRTDKEYGPVAFPDGSYADGTVGKGPSATPESYMDTAVINGVAYPVLNVEPKAYRVRFLNGANDRYFNVSLWQADSTIVSTDGRTNTEVTIIPFGSQRKDANGNLLNTSNDPAGIPDPSTAGPSIIQFANEAGFLPKPVVHKPTLMSFDINGEEIAGDFYLGSAERADTVIDFSQFAGKTLIMYNDGTAPVPGGDPRYDYYTGDADQSAFGGASSTLAGYGPNTRTLMQIRVAATLVNGAVPKAADAYDPAGDGGPMATELPKVYTATADPHVVGALPGAADTNFGALPQSVNADANTMLLADGSTVNLTIKTIHGYTDANIGRLIAQLGTELPAQTAGAAAVPTPLSYIDMPTEILSQDEIQYWWIKNYDVDNHPMHFHLFNVQVLAHRLHDSVGTLRPPIPDEMGWKETVKNWPGEDVIVAVKPKTPQLPFGLPNSVRMLDPTMHEGATANDVLYGTTVADGVKTPYAFAQYDLDATSPNYGASKPVANSSYNFGWEYVWHCHILGHEENDLMRPMVYKPVINLSNAPSNVAVDATGAVTWTDATPAATDSTKGNSTNEIGFRVERALVTTATGVALPSAFAALKPTSPVVDGRVNTLANATKFQDAPAKFADYAYQVVSVNEAGEVTSASASPVVLAQTPATPTAVSVAAGLVKWTDASTNETGFRIERASVDTNTGAAVVGNFAMVGTVAANVTTFQDVPLANVDYQYRVVAVNAAATPADSIASATASIAATPAQPSISSIDSATGLVTWIDNASNETSYIVERATVSTNASGVQTVSAFAQIGGTLAANTQTLAGFSLAANTDYRYRVTAKNAAGSSVSPIFTYSATVPAAVGSVSVTSAGVVTWLFSASNGVTGYQVNRATVTGGVASAFAPLTTVGAVDTYTDATVAANTDYQYQVVAMKGAALSVANPVATLAQAPLAATGLAASLVTATGLTLKWVDGSTNEDGFSVEVSTDGGTSWTVLTTAALNTATYAVTGLAPGSYYTFRVAATKNLAGYTPVYTTTPVVYTPATLVAPVVTAMSSLVNGLPQALVTWTSTSVGQTGFTVERCAGTTATCAAATANWTMLASVAGTGAALSYLDTTLASGATYVYRVKTLATNTSVVPNVTASVQGLSAQTSTAVTVAAPTNLSATSPTGVGVTLAWTDNSSNETSFQVIRNPAFAAAVNVTRTTALKAATGGAVSYVDTTAVAGITYDYYVLAANTAGTTVSVSAASNTVNFTLAMPAPTGLTAVQSGANMLLTWTDTSASETAFEILRTDSTGVKTTFTILRTAAQATSVNTAVTYSDTTAMPATVYTYAVRAVNIPVVGAPATAVSTASVFGASVTASVVLPAPTSLTTAVPPSGTGAILSWVDNATFETAYRIDRAVVTLDAKGNVPAGTVYTTLATQAQTGNVVRTTGATAYTDLTATALTATNPPQVYAYQVYAVTTTVVPAPVGGVATTVTSFSAPSNEAHTAAASVVTGAPTGLTAATSNGTSIVLSWIDNSSNENAFLVTRTDPAGTVVTFTSPARSAALKTAIGGTVSYTDATAAVGTTYTYTVAAVTSAAGAVPVVTGAPSASIQAGLTVNAPSNATAAQTATGITISWTDNSTNEIGFQIVRTGVDALGAVVAQATFNVTSTAAQKTASATARSYIDTTAVPGVTYTYTVAATSGTAALPVPGVAISTTPVTITETIAAPSVPTAVITSATRITVTWTDLSTNETGFKVERLLTPTVAGTTTPVWTTLATVARTGTATTGINTAVSYVDNLIAPAVQGTYQYRVSAVSMTGTVLNAASTAVASNVLDFNLPAAPTALTVAAGAAGSGAVTLGWTDNATNETGYTIQRATNTGFTTGLVTTAVPGAVAGGSTSYTLSGMAKGTKYFFRVAATNAAGTSAYVASTVAVAVP